jgi:FeS assembly SUF system protein
MFSWLSKRHTQKPASADRADRADQAEHAAHTNQPAAAPAPAALATPESPLAAAIDESYGSHGLNVDALVAPPPAASASGDAQPAVGPSDPAQSEALTPPIVEAISTVFDPEIPVNIYELGLIYEIIVDADRRVGVRMTLTSPACPSAQQLPSEVRYKVKAVEGVADCAVDVIWEPPWTKEMMSEAAKLSLGLF